ncbi:MAG: tRNA epoxyqueuosine(34) reductase QueG, partial [Mesorhizobium sp.]
ASPLVRGAAVWALSRLLPAIDFAQLAATALATEDDMTVRDEWLSALPAKVHA